MTLLCVLFFWGPGDKGSLTQESNLIPLTARVHFTEEAKPEASCAMPPSTYMCLFEVSLPGPAHLRGGLFLGGLVS